jgi:hypothetical protein
VPPIKFWLDEPGEPDLSAEPGTDAERNQNARRESLLRWAKVLHMAVSLAAVLTAFGFFSEDKLFKGLGPILILVFEGGAWLLKKAAKDQS